MKDSVLKSTWIALDRRLNSPRGFRVLLSVFLVVAIVFSAVPLLHYFRGRSIMDYKLWYDTGKHVLAGDEIFSLHNGKYDFMYPTILQFRPDDRIRERHAAAPRTAIVTKNLSAMTKDIFDLPRTRLRKAMGISTTRNVRLLRTIISNTILKPAGGGDAYSSNRERRIAKNPDIESRTPVNDLARSTELDEWPPASESCVALRRSNYYRQTNGTAVAAIRATRGAIFSASFNVEMIIETELSWPGIW